MTTMAASVTDGVHQGSALTRYQVLAGALLIQLILGTVYGYSVFWEPLEAAVFPAVMTAEEHARRVAAGEAVAGAVIVADADEARRQRDLYQGYLKHAFSICILSFAAVMVFAGRVQDLKGPRFTTIVGAALMGGGFLLAGLLDHPIVYHLAHAVLVGVIGVLLLLVVHAVFGRLDADEYPLVRYVPFGVTAAVIVAGVLVGTHYVGRAGEFDRVLLLWGTVGFLAGAGIGFAYVCPIAALIKWFPKQKGFVAGLAVAGFGFGAWVFASRSPIGALGFISEHGIVNFFLVHGMICIVALVFGAMLLRNPPGTPSGTGKVSDSSWQETLRRPAFYVLWLMYFSGAMAGLMVIGIIKVFAGDQLVDAAGVDRYSEAGTALMMKGAAAVGWLAIFNAIGRIFWGFVSDRVGRTTAFVAMFVVQAVVMFLLAGLRTEVSLAVGASLVGFNYGGIFALFPSATADLFGAKNLGANYGWLFTSYGIAGVVGIAAGNAAQMRTGSYFAAFALAGVLCLVSAVLSLVLHVRSRAAPAGA